MMGRSKIRTPEQRSKKKLKEERIIIDLELAVKKEELKKNLKTKPRVHEGYIKDRSHDCWLSTSDVDV